MSIECHLTLKLKLWKLSQKLFNPKEREDEKINIIHYIRPGVY